MTAEQLHRDALVIDSHNDTIVAHIVKGHAGFFSSETNEPDQPGTIALMRGRERHAAKIQIDFPLMRRSGIDVAFFAIDVTLAFKNHLNYALDGFGYFLNDIDRSGEEIVIVRGIDDVEKAGSSGNPGALPAVEHADVVEGSLNVLRMLYELGVRSIGLTHNRSSQAADGCLEARGGVGLTHFGKALIREMNRLGMIVDLAHVSPGAFYSALEVAERPVIFSHGNARALCDHPRNLDDDQLRAPARNGGVIGMSYVPFFVHARKPSLARLLDHIEHVAEIAGVDSVGLGSDFDGGGTLLSDATQVPGITAGLLERGFGETDTRKVLGENILRVLREGLRPG